MLFGTPMSMQNLSRCNMFIGVPKNMPPRENAHSAEGYFRIRKIARQSAGVDSAAVAPP